MDAPLWSPSHSQIQQSAMQQFIKWINTKHALQIQDYTQLHLWSVSETALFWQSVSQWCELIFHSEAQAIFKPTAHMIDSQWFPGSSLNFAENCLHTQNDSVAIIETNEKNQTKKISYRELYQAVSQLALYLRQLGITSKDSVAICLPNNATAIIAMLATASIGATFTSCAPEFGLDAILDRLSQIQPAVLVGVLEHTYDNKTHCHIKKLQQLNQALPLKKLIIDDTHTEDTHTPTIPNSIRLSELPITDQPIIFSPQAFNHPLYILFSSGTTGQPKGIVHSVGGTLLQHKKEHQLHCDINDNSVVFFYTTTGWMMWNWMVSALSSGATLVCYDGSPTYPKSDRLFSLVEQFAITHFGLGAKLLEHMEQKNAKPQKNYNLSSLKNLLTTGSPLLPGSFDYVYQHIKSDLCLSSISGGTDIISCFALGNPTLPVYRGQLQCKGLGMDVAVFDDQGGSLHQQQGELVCRTPFPSMPTGFLNDTNNEKYRQAYFSQFDNVWAQSDFAMITEQQGLIIYGRSDTTLNPGGVRIGTAEIYRALTHIDDIGDAIAVGLPSPQGETVVLFLQQTATLHLNEEKINEIKNGIRQRTSPHHVPHHIHIAPDLPRTLSGKLSESAVKKTLLGQTINNHSALSNPASLDYFKQLFLNHTFKTQSSD